MSLADRLRGKPAQILLALILIGIGVVFLVDWMVLTEEEKIEILVQDARDCFVAGDWPGLEQCLGPGFDAQPVGLLQIERWCKGNEFVEASASLGSVRFDEKNPGRAQSRVRAWGKHRDGKTESQFLLFKFERAGEDWKIQQVRLWFPGS